MRVSVGEIPAHLNTMEEYLFKHECVSNLFSVTKYTEVTKINVNFASLNGYKTCLYFMERL